MTNEEYDEKLIARLTDIKKWHRPEPSNDFYELSKRVGEDVRADLVSGKIASIFVKHQIIHEMTRDLISMSILYLQGEIWPSRIRPAYDDNSNKETSWYLIYLRDHTIDIAPKVNYIENAFELNRLRNEVAHHLVGKNEAIINETYKTFNDLFQKAFDLYKQCNDKIHAELSDLVERVDFANL